MLLVAITISLRFKYLSVSVDLQRETEERLELVVRGVQMAVVVLLVREVRGVALVRILTARKIVDLDLVLEADF